MEIHPRLAGKHGIRDGEWVEISSRRGTMKLRAQVVTTIRPDTIFIPYHWSGRKSVNQLTISAQDPVSKIPEFKVCAVRIRPIDPPTDASMLQATGTATFSSSPEDDDPKERIQQGR